MLYQVDLDEDVLLYHSVTREGEVSGEIKNADDLFDATSKLLEHHKTDRVDLVLRYIKLKDTRSSGICPKSYPKSDLSIRLLGKLNICLGGQSGLELVHFPYEGTIFDQPNIFIEAFYIWIDEYNKYMRVKQRTMQNQQSKPR